MPKFVRHISGSGQQYEVMETTPPQPAGFRFRDEKEWAVYANDQRRAWLILPKSDYHEVPAPEVWVDVTKDCNIQFNGEIWHDCKNVTFYSSHIDQQEKDRIYRLRKVMLWRMMAKANSYDPVDAFIVEKRTPRHSPNAVPCANSSGTGMTSN